MAGTWGDLNQGSIFNKMTTPTTRPTPTPAPGGAPTNLADFLSQAAGRNQSTFGDVGNYRGSMAQDRTNPHAGNYDPKGSPLADLGNYLSSNPFAAWKTGDGGFDEAQFNSYNTVNGQQLYQKNPETGKWEINPLGRMGELNNKFKGLNFRLEEDPSLGYEDSRPNMRLVWDHTALPKDAFGNYGTSVNPEGFEDGRNGTLRNPNAVYDDPFYGRITHRQNMQQHEDWFDVLNDNIGPLLMSIAGMGLGGALGGAGLLGGGFSPSTIMSLGQGARGAMNGNIGNLLASIASMGMGPLTGLSGMPLNLARAGSSMAVSQLLNRGRGG